MMMYKETTKVIPLGDDREITISTGKLAKQADGAVVVKQGDTMLLATVVAAKDAKPDVDFMPLSVEYKEKYAAGKAVLPRVTGIAKAEPPGREGGDVGQQAVGLQPQIHLAQEGVDGPHHQGRIHRHLHRDGQGVLALQKPPNGEERHGKDPPKKCVHVDAPSFSCRISRLMPV